MSFLAILSGAIGLFAFGCIPLFLLVDRDPRASRRPRKGGESA